VGRSRKERKKKAPLKDKPLPPEQQRTAFRRQYWEAMRRGDFLVLHGEPYLRSAARL
jgi:hypothetical protein